MKVVLTRLQGSYITLTSRFRQPSWKTHCDGVDISHEARGTVALWVTICEASGERAVVLWRDEAPGDDALSPFCLVFEHKPTICSSFGLIIVFHHAAPQLHTDVLNNAGNK